MKRKHFKPTLQLLLIMLITIMAFSCGKHKESCVGKFIFIRTGGIAELDGNNTVHFKSIYIEYCNDSILKIAKGKLFVFNCDSLPQAKFKFSKFYKMTLPNNFKSIIDTAFCDKLYDSIYLIPTEWSEHSLTLSILIYYTANGEKAVFFHDNLNPKDLNPLINKLDSVILSENLIEINKFKIDTTILNNEKELYKLLTPPPPPPGIEQKVKFTKPKN